MPAYDAVLLDLYDTVARTDWPALGARLADRLGVDRATLYEALGATREARSVGAYGSRAGDLGAVAEHLGLEPNPALIEDLLALENDLIAGGVHLWHDTEPTVRALSGRGVRTALVSNCSHSTRPIVERLDLDTLFDAVILSFEVGAAKPDPAIYRAALDRIRVTSDRSIFVDDQTRYCDGARAIGLDTALILRPGDEPPDGVEANGHRVVTDLGFLLDA